MAHVEITIEENGKGTILIDGVDVSRAVSGFSIVGRRVDGCPRVLLHCVAATMKFESVDAFSAACAVPPPNTNMVGGQLHQVLPILQLTDKQLEALGLDRSGFPVESEEAADTI